jgi:hypothetical protein
VGGRDFQDLGRILKAVNLVEDESLALMGFQKRFRVFERPAHAGKPEDVALFLAVLNLFNPEPPCYHMQLVFRLGEGISCLLGD